MGKKIEISKRFLGIIMKSTVVKNEDFEVEP